MTYTLWVTFFLILFILLQYTSADLVSIVCAQTRNNTLCSQTLYNSSEYSNNTDAKGLAYIMIGAALDRAAHNLVYLKGLISNQTSTKPNNSNQCLQVCYKDYSLVVKAIIPNANQSLSAGTTFVAAVAILYSADKILDCQDEDCVKMSSILNDKCNEYADFAQLVADVLRVTPKKINY
ncbi:hypothetical protein H5410_048325 [Solanum commersonii]|uniref:Pectinesterase inhibitor domain-containing protein n=1 Tax=Solanum commersonii TaxID=4109 RepID=A0A9J5XHU9_SOLCO|nr:hypothetical protein H5410_048325 [Solanum commersonii]